MPLRSRSQLSSTSLVEHRTSMGGRDLQLSVYDTTVRAFRVGLRSSHPMYCGMITGRKVVHLPDAEAGPFPFVPGESLVVPPMQPVHIDFPESDEEPTRCLTLEIDPDKVDAIVDRLNDTLPRPPEADPWTYDPSSFVHFPHSDGIERVLQSMLSLFQEDLPHRDLIIDLNASELIVRMLQSESRFLLLGNRSKDVPQHGLAAAIQYAREHLADDITVDDLAEAACMSTSTFYRYFRTEFGTTPHQFLTDERVSRARELLDDPDATVAAVSAMVGFQSTSHFIRVFKSVEGTTPKQYQLRRPSAARRRTPDSDERGLPSSD